MSGGELNLDFFPALNQSCWSLNECWWGSKGLEVSPALWTQTDTPLHTTDRPQSRSRTTCVTVAPTKSKLFVIKVRRSARRLFFFHVFCFMYVQYLFYLCFVFYLLWFRFVTWFVLISFCLCTCFRFLFACCCSLSRRLRGNVYRSHKPCVPIQSAICFQTPAQAWQSDHTLQITAVETYSVHFDPVDHPRGNWDIQMLHIQMMQTRENDLCDLWFVQRSDMI